MKLSSGVAYQSSPHTGSLTVRHTETQLLADDEDTLPSDYHSTVVIFFGGTGLPSLNKSL